VQARSVAEALERECELEVEIVPVETAGDRGERTDKSRFVKEIEMALVDGEVDLAVHSAKDVPGQLPDGLALVGAPAAEDPRDALVGARSLEQMPAGTRIGTGSLRRRSQLLAMRPDFRLEELRGNVDTRLEKLARGEHDVIVLALAGLRRLGRGEEAVAIDADTLVPAPGQGVLALEARAGDGRAADAAERISDRAALARLEAERAVVVALDASCYTPVGAHARLEGESLRLQAYVGLPDGSEWIRDELAADCGAASRLGQELGERLIAAGAEDILIRLKP
jgi:hydroxymethylbilane synthase